MKKPKRVQRSKRTKKAAVPGKNESGTAESEAVQLWMRTVLAEGADKQFAAETIASIAARLSPSEDANSSCERALELLGAASRLTNIRRLKSELRNSTLNIPFPDAVKEITELSDTDYAEERYREFLEQVFVPLMITEWAGPKFLGTVSADAPLPSPGSGVVECTYDDFVECFLADEERDGINELMVFLRKILFRVWQPKKKGPTRDFTFLVAKDLSGDEKSSTKS